MRDASAEGIAIIFPDTSPRGAGIEGEQDDWDFGIGSSYPVTIFFSCLLTSSTTTAAAGWYLDATHPKWAKHYMMFTHVTQELPQVIEAAGLPVVRYP